MSENLIRLQINKKRLESAKIDNWYQLKGTMELLEMVASGKNLKVDQLRFNINTKQKRGEECVIGVYIHPVLVNSLATWMSPCYAIKINEIINQLNITEQKNTINSLTKEVQVKCDIIEEMCKKFNEISEYHRVTVKNNKIEYEKVMGDLRKTTDDLKVATDNLFTTSRSLNRAVGLIDEVKYDTLYIFEIKISLDTSRYYTCYRILEENAEKTFKKHEGYLVARNIYEKNSVNATEAWKRFKRNNNDVCIKTNGKFYNDFVLLNGYTENSLIFDLNNLFATFDNLN